MGLRGNIFCAILTRHADVQTYHVYEKKNEPDSATQTLAA